MYVKFFQDLVKSFELQNDNWGNNWQSNWILKEKIVNDSKTYSVK